MILRTIFKFLYVPIFYTDRIKKGFAGYSNGVYIKIRPEYKEDEGLHLHELEHCKQWYKTLGFSGMMSIYARGTIFKVKLPEWLVTYAKSWKYKYELKAYAVQALHEHSVVAQKYAAKVFAGYIANKYGLDVSEDVAFKDLCELMDV